MADLNHILRHIWKSTSLLWKRPERAQLAALCYREIVNGKEILLITSRKNHRYIIPKGWPMADKSDADTAAQEAFEEAGIVGNISQTPLGDYHSYKSLGKGLKVKTRVIVFPLKVSKQKDDFPEKGQRKYVWLPIKQAAEKCDDIGLENFLYSVCEKDF